MLTLETIDLLRCPTCAAGELKAHAFSGDDLRGIRDGVTWCEACAAWYPIEDGILDMLCGDLAYREDRRRFRERFLREFERLSLAPDAEVAKGGAELQAKQQQHFDWYAANDKQSYLSYEQMPFWVAVDAMTFDGWRDRLEPGSLILDVGCGNGRSTFKVMDLDLRILAFDVSKAAIRQAQQRYEERPYRARPVFFTADATRFPLKDASIDSVLIYGVLHHVPDPKAACHEVARVLRPGGMYIGSENNQTVFRAAFDLLQKLNPLWYEEAGPEALISAQTLAAAFEGTGVGVRTFSSVYLPPHLINLVGARIGRRLLSATDNLARVIPGLKHNGGLIVIEGVKA